MADRIEKTLELDVPVDKAWFTLTDLDQFAQWTGMQFEAPFAVGKTLRGSVAYEEYSHVTVEIDVVALDAPTLFSFTWHPHATEAGRDYSAEAKTRVDLRLAPSDHGCTLTMTETGFDSLEPDRIDDSYAAHVGGWDMFAASYVDVVAK